jgi:hypothetical protein
MHVRADPKEKRLFPQFLLHFILLNMSTPLKKDGHFQSMVVRRVEDAHFSFVGKILAHLRNGEGNLLHRLVVRDNSFCAM